MPAPPARPESCFWELTRRCGLACPFCRTGASDPAPDELDAAEALDVADQLVALGTRFVILTGGEPVLYPGWQQVARRLADGGVRVRLFTSGFAFDEKTLANAQRAGVHAFSISLDGPRSIHDDLRPFAEGGEFGASSFDLALSAIQLVVASGAPHRVVTQVNRINVGFLNEVYELLVAEGVTRWQVHLCQMTGRAGRSRAELACHPADLEAIVRVLIRAAKEKKLVAPMHCTVGYMTAEEPVLRGREVSRRAVFDGCAAGRRTFAIDARGGVKGCTTLPDEFVTASIRERPLDAIWADDDCFPYTRRWSAEVLSGGCADCAYAAVCRAGCPAVAYGATGSVGANPYCLRRVRAATTR